MSARARRNRNEENARSTAQSATEAVAFSTMAGMMALGLAQKANASAEKPAADANGRDGDHPTEAHAGQKIHDGQPGHAAAEIPGMPERPPAETIGEATENHTAEVETAEATQSAETLDTISLAASPPPPGNLEATSQQSAMHAAAEGSPPMTSGYEPTILAPPPAAEQLDIPAADPMLAQSLATLATSLEGLNATLQNAFHSAPGLPAAAQIAGNLQTALAEVTATLDTAVAEIGAIQSMPEALSVAFGGQAPELPAVQPVVTLGDTIGFSAIADPVGATLLEIMTTGDRLTQSESATECLDLPSGIATLPAIGFAGLSYADAIDPYDASQPPAGSVLHGLV